MTPTTLTAPAPASGLDEIDAHRAVTVAVTHLLEDLDSRQAAGRCLTGDCCDHPSVAEALGDAGRRCEDLQAITTGLLAGLDADHPTEVARLAGQLAAVTEALTTAIADAGTELDAGCWHNCPELPHTHSDAIAFAADLLDLLDAHGHHLTRRGGA